MATNDPNFPDPNGPKPAGVSDAAWYGYTTVDSTKPLAQWTSWEAEGKYDPTAKGYARFKSSKVDANGNPIQGLFEHPDACPDGTTAYGQNQCLPIQDPRIQGSWSIDPRTGQSGGVPGSASTPAAPPPPPTWGANGMFNASGGGSNANATQTSPLQQMLQDMFSQRQGSLFGKSGPYAGSLGISGNGNALPSITPDKRQARALGGGGLMWTEDGTGLGDFGNKTPTLAASAPAAPKPSAPAASGGTLSNSIFGNIGNTGVFQPNKPTNPNIPPPNYPGPAAGANLSDYLTYQKQLQAGSAKQQQGQQQTKASTLTPTPFPNRNGMSAAGY